MMGIGLAAANRGVLDREMGIASEEFVVVGERATTAMAWVSRLLESWASVRFLGRCLVLKDQRTARR
jgi:hypothetical protein